MNTSMKKYIIWPLISIIVFSILAELTLIIIDVNPHPQGRDFTVNRALDYPEVFLKDSYLFWRLRPDQHITSEFFEGKTYQINRLGFRGGNFRLTREGLRVAVLGNSCSFGWGVGFRETFGYLIQQQLRSAGYERAQVYNYSVPGYSSFQGKRNYLKNVSKFKPDILIITFGWNDQWLAANARPDNLQEFPPEIIVALQNIMARSRFYRFMKSAVFSILPAGESDKAPPLARVSLDDFKMNLSEIIDSAKADDAKIILLTSPIPSLVTYFNSAGRSYLHENHLIYNDAIRETAAVHSVGLVDLAAIFDQYSNLFDNPEKDPFHYNKLGHDLAAVEIFKFIQDWSP